MSAKQRRRTLSEAFTLRQQRAFMAELRFLLDMGMSAAEIARAFRVLDAPTVERRLARMGATESVLAERFRRRKPGYCSVCRRCEDQHSIDCRQGYETRDRLLARARRSRRVAA